MYFEGVNSVCLHKVEIKDMCGLIIERHSIGMNTKEDKYEHTLYQGYSLLECHEELWPSFAFMVTLMSHQQLRFDELKISKGIEENLLTFFLTSS